VTSIKPFGHPNLERTRVDGLDSGHAEFWPSLLCYATLPLHEADV
jgi:hypothetical protein